MEVLSTDHLLATVIVFLIALVFSMLGLGGGMLYVPVFKWLELPLKTVGIFAVGCRRQSAPSSWHRWVPGAWITCRAMRC